MPQLETGMRARAAALGERHRLFAAALVTVGCVLAADWHVAVGLVCGVLFGGIGGYLHGWRVALVGLLCGWVSIGVFQGRLAARSSAEAALLGHAGGEVAGRVLKDGKGSGKLWSAPAVLLDGPQAEAYSA